MNKKTDFSDLTKKLNIDGIVGSIKSMINPEGETPAVDPDDAIGVKLATISTKMQHLAVAHQEQVKELKEVNILLNGLYEDIKALRASHSTTTESTVQQQTEEAEVKPEETEGHSDKE